MCYACFGKVTHASISIFCMYDTRACIPNHVCAYANLHASISIFCIFNTRACIPNHVCTYAHLHMASCMHTCMNMLCMYMYSYSQHHNHVQISCVCVYNAVHVYVKSLEAPLHTTNDVHMLVISV
jgi:hypothetical protein